MKYTIHTYKELEQWTDAFASGSFSLFFLIGNPGQAKSSILRKKMKKNALWIEGGNVTSFKLYQELYNHRNEPLVLDDVDSVYSDRSLIRLLKCLCQTEEVKNIGWHSNSSVLEKVGIPTSFDTKTRVAIIANRWETLSEHIGSLEDRGMMISFQPDPQEVFNRAKVFVKDREVLRFVNSNLHLLDNLSMRSFINAVEAKRIGLDWKGAVIESLGIRELLVIEKLKANRRFGTNEQRISAFMKETGLSRPMWFKYNERLGKRAI